MPRLRKGGKSIAAQKSRSVYAAHKRSKKDTDDVQDAEDVATDAEPPSQRRRCEPTPLVPLADDITTALQDEANIVITEEHVRVAIAVYFVKVLGRPSVDEWHGRGGVITTIENDLKLKSRKTVTKVLEDVEECIKAQFQIDSLFLRKMYMYLLYLFFEWPAFQVTCTNSL